MQQIIVIYILALYITEYNIIIIIITIVVIELRTRMSSLPAVCSSQAWCYKDHPYTSAGFLRHPDRKAFILLTHLNSSNPDAPQIVRRKIHYFKANLNSNQISAIIQLQI